MIFGAYAILIILLNVFVGPAMQARNTPQTPVPFIAEIAGAGLCVYFSLYRMLPGGLLPSLAQFQANMLCALAGAELVALIGLFMGYGPVGPLPSAAIALALQFGFVLPKLLAYLRSSDSAG